MKQIQIYHEAPLDIFEKVQEVTDGDYALVHLLEKDAMYAAKFTETRSKHPERTIILDNSAYELGESFDKVRYADWIEVLEPDVYIVPDAPGNYEETLDAFSDWSKVYGPRWGLRMGVLQGSTMQECVNCFKQLRSLGAYIIGIPFLIGRHLNSNGHVLSNFDLMAARVTLIEILQQDCNPLPIHLLGVALPQEGVYYRDKESWVVSVDTSNPVLHGMFGTKYLPGGITEKRSELLADNIHRRLSVEEKLAVLHNIAEFRNMWRR